MLALTHTHTYRLCVLCVTRVHKPAHKHVLGRAPTFTVSRHFCLFL